ncbi:helix-turn-helix transcriptional regulator [Bacillus sp. NPDC077027]|uniref:helix-turn-helix transcriptional regulator n=1 Tax=Bacillus sp. NPDC077027 TaxID=3390548 RepID=UPI003D006252
MSEVKKILMSYVPMAKTVANMFGSACEVVIHDLTQPQSSVIFTINNHVTGRQVGQSFDHLVKQVLLSEEFQDDYLAGYEFKTPDARTIKASTTLIRDENDQVVGAFCINYDMSLAHHVKEMMNQLIPGFSTELPGEDMKEKKDPIQSVVDIADQLIEQIISSNQAPLTKRHEKIELIRFMDEKGIFLMKGSVDKVAEKLGISKVTVYSYLDEIKKKTKDSHEGDFQ